MFADIKNGWIVSYGSILHSNNGGQSWIAQEKEAGHWFYNIAFADGNKGWAVGDFGVIVHTLDAGNKWSVQAAKNSSG